MSTGLAIFVAMFLKGALVIFLRKRGWWPDWEELDLRKQQEKKLLRAYRKWRKDAGAEAAAELCVTLDRIAHRAGDGRAVNHRAG